MSLAASCTEVSSSNLLSLSDLPMSRMFIRRRTVVVKNQTNEDPDIKMKTSDTPDYRQLTLHTDDFKYLRADGYYRNGD